MESAEVPILAGRRAFGADPHGYDQARPDYPQAVYDYLGTLCSLEGANLFEVGAGTGIATRQLLRFLPARLTAIEPDERSADYLRRNTASSAPELDVVCEAFEEAGLPLASYDLGVAATSFHWLEQDAALRKVFDLLKPRGWWAMWWNVFGDPDEPDDFQRASDPLFRELAASRSWPHDGRRPFALETEMRISQMQAAGLADTHFRRMHWTLMMDTAGVQALAATFSQVSQAGEEQRSAFLRELGELVEREFGGCVERRFSTVLYAGRKPE